MSCLTARAHLGIVEDENALQDDDVAGVDGGEVVWDAGVGLEIVDGHLGGSASRYVL